MARAALVESCWPTTARARKAVTPLSSRSGNHTGPAFRNAACNCGETPPAMRRKRRWSLGSILGSLEGREHLLELVHLVRDRAALALEEILDRVGEAGVANPMRAVGRGGEITALNLVRALRPGLDAFQAARDREIDGAVIARLEMQEGKIADAAPIAAVKRVATHQVQGARDVAPVLLGHHQHHAFAHALAQQVEEFARQIGRAPFLVRGRGVEAEERIPVPGFDRGAGKRLYCDAVIGLAPLAFYLFALARIERAEKIVEALIALILPMKLPSQALQESRRGEQLVFRLGRKGHMQRRDFRPLGDLDHRRRQEASGFRRRAGADQQPVAGHRRERHRHLEFGVITSAGAFISLGPAVVEHVFAVGVAFQIHRRRGHEIAVAVFEREMLRQPAGFGAGRVRFLERIEEGVADKGIVRSGAFIPIRGANLGKPLDHLDRKPVAAVHRQRTSNTASTSTATLPGSAAMPTAERACLPASPNTSPISSEHPFTTCGWSVKSGVELTKPTSLTQRTTRSRSSPSAAFTCVNRLRPHSRAACLPSSSEISRPSLPMKRFSPCQWQSWPETNSKPPVRTVGT